jgi:hypothetical protein
MFIAKAIALSVGNGFLDDNRTLTISFLFIQDDGKEGSK